MRSTRNIRVLPHGARDVAGLQPTHQLSWDRLLTMISLKVKLCRAIKLHHQQGPVQGGSRYLSPSLRPSRPSAAAWMELGCAVQKGEDGIAWEGYTSISCSALASCRALG